MLSTQLVDLFQRARKDEELAVIEGVQAVKHAVRFGAEIRQIITCDKPLLGEYLNTLAPDMAKKILADVIEVEPQTFFKLSPQPPRTKVIALATRRKYELGNIEPGKPIVFLEDPRDLENIGAVIRVAAAAEAGAVAVSGPVDIWHPAVIRGAAGLHYAVPVLNVELSDVSQNRTVVALDPQGENIRDSTIQKNAVLVFGTERRGIKKQTLDSSGRIVRLPMREGVSSLNLATSVAATLYMM